MKMEYTLGTFLIVIAYLSHVVADNGAFTNFVNMEKLYTLEDELITLTDVIIRQEKVLHGDEDVHGIYNVSGTVEKVKAIHREIVSNRNLTSYITNPVNIYHMTKRLAKDWTKVIATLEDSKSCSKVMRNKVENIAENMPDGYGLKHVIKGVLRLQAIYNISVDDVISGNFSEFRALSSLSLDDAFEFARVAYDNEYHFLAIAWLQKVKYSYDEKDAKTFTIGNAMNLLASAYLKLKRPSDALATLDDLHRIDPLNVVATRNSKYILMKIDSGFKDEIVEKQELKNKKDNLLQKYCKADARGKRIGPNQFCTYTSSRNKGYFDGPNIKTEVLRRRPLIVLYRDMTTISQQKAVAHMGYEQMKNVMYRSRYSHPNGIDGMHVEDNTHWQWIPNLQKTLDNIDISEREPLASNLVVRNVGLHGMDNTRLVKADRTRLGTFVIFLGEPKYGGGNVVFPFASITVKPEKGTILFYERTVHKQATICPVIADTQWVGIYPLEDQFYSDVCYRDFLRRPTKK